MKVSEFIAQLQLLDQDAPVLVASDEEGNSIGTAYGAFQYRAQRDGSYFDIINDEDVDDYDPDDIVDVVVIWP